MKKLLITTMAAVSVGLCAKADTGISFDDANYEVDANLFNVSDQTGKYIVTSGWTTDATSDELFKIIEVDYPEEAVVRHADLSENEKALFIDTSVPLLRNAQEMSNGDYSYPAQDVTTPVFFDSVVQFTATDVAPTATAGKDKLVVWLYATPEDGEKSLGETAPVTNLVVTAGDWSTGSLIPTNYLTNVGIEPNSWHRLTIKSFEKDDLIKFNVWVDGIPVEISGIEAFDSLVEDGALNYNKLQGVAFDGKGAVDDIVFTTTAPEFAQGGEPTEATYAIAATYNAEHVFVSYYEDDGGTVEIANASAIDIEKATVYAFIEMKDGAELTGVKLNGNSVDIPVMADGGYNILLPLGTPTSGATYTLEISTTKTAGGGSGEEPEDPEDPAKPTIGGVEVVVDDNGKITNITTADNGKPVVGELDTTKFAEYYTVSVTDGVLSIALNPAVATPEINETATDKDDAITVTDTAVALGVTNAKPGLWYGAQAYSDVACADDDKIGAVTGWVKATTTTVSVTAEKPEASAAFFKVVVDDQDHTTATPPAEQE